MSFSVPCFPQEFRSGLKDDLTNLFDEYILEPMNNLKRAVDSYRDIMSGIKALPSTVDDFIAALDTIPEQMQVSWFEKCNDSILNAIHVYRYIVCH